MLEAPAEMLAEHARVEQELADPAVHGDQAKARALGKRYAELTPVVETHRELQELAGDLATPASSRSTTSRSGPKCR